MEYRSDLTRLPELLLPWYETHKRELPWRTDKEPYHIWLSEIMLQQTRVEAVKGYYTRFLQEIPTIASLAMADDDHLHKLWEGLGYYSRVRNMKKAAVAVMEHHNGVFPSQYSDVLALPGVGAYTAGAICSIAFGQPTPAVDGNVLRLMSRLLNDPTPIDDPEHKKQIGKRLAEIYPADAGAFTQALMELGATLCGPNTAPACDKCPCKGICLGYKAQTAPSLPVKQPKKTRRVEEKTVFILSFEGKYALQKRPNRGLLASMWQFPDVEGKLSLEAAVREVEGMNLTVREICRQVERKHVFTHVQWHMRGYYMEVSYLNDRFTWRTAAQIEEDAALPTAYRQFWQAISI